MHTALVYWLQINYVTFFQKDNSDHKWLACWREKARFSWTTEATNPWLSFRVIICYIRGKTRQNSNSVMSAVYQLIGVHPFGISLAHLTTCNCACLLFWQPWDSTELWLAELAPNGHSLMEETKRKVCGTTFLHHIDHKFAFKYKLAYFQAVCIFIFHSL